MRLIDGDKLVSIFAQRKEVWRGNGVLPSNESLMWIAAMDITKNVPTVDAAPVKHGRWVENKYGYITCSICDSFPLETMTGSLITMHYEPYESEYCPHCGAKMDLEETP